MKKTILFISIMLTILIPTIPIKGYAKTYAYLFAQKEIIKLDTESDIIVNKVMSPYKVQGYLDFKEAGCAIDLINKYLITGYNNYPGTSGFYVYDLQTLKQVKFVSFPNVIKQPVDSKIIYPQNGTKFYVSVDDGSLNSGEGGVVNLSYDKKTHSYLGDVSNILIDIEEKFWFSEDQFKIYVKNQQGNLRVYDSQTLSLITSIDLSNVYAKNVWGKGIDDIKSGVILLGENNKLQDVGKNNMSFLTFNIATALTSTRVVTGMDDETTLLTPDAKKVIFVEAQGSSYVGTKAPPKVGTMTGKIHVYDAQTGNKLGLVILPTDFSGQVLGIRPTSDKLYYKIYSRDESKIRLEVVDLVGLKVIKEISVPNLYFMVFFDE